MNGIYWAIICGVVSVSCIVFLVRDCLLKRQSAMQRAYNKKVNETPVLKSFLLEINSEYDWVCAFDGKLLKFFIPDLKGKVFVEFNLNRGWSYYPGDYSRAKDFARIKEFSKHPEYVSVSENVIRDVCSVATKLRKKLDGKVSKLKVNRLETSEMLGF